MKLFVWDYHGVLEQGNEISALHVTNLVLKQFGYAERLSERDAIRLYGSKWFEYFEYVLPEENHEKHLELQQAGFDYTTSNFDFVASFIKPNPNADKVLKEISKNHKQILISNTDPKTLKHYIKIANIDGHFTSDLVFAANGHSKDSKKSKKIILKEYLQGKNFEEIIIIGDSPSDMALKEVAGGKTYLYCHPGMKHRECVADYRITNLNELLVEI